MLHSRVVRWQATIHAARSLCCFSRYLRNGGVGRATSAQRSILRIAPHIVCYMHSSSTNLQVYRHMTSRKNKTNIANVSINAVDVPRDTGKDDDRSGSVFCVAAGGAAVQCTRGQAVMGQQQRTHPSPMPVAYMHPAVTWGWVMVQHSTPTMRTATWLAASPEV